jgi:hypothetical protein
MSFKDNLIAMQLKSYLNDLLKDQGEVLEVKLDTTKKSINGTLKLNSEPEKVLLSVEKYEISKENDKYFLNLHAVTSSHEELLKKHLTKNRYEIPAIAAQML